MHPALRPPAKPFWDADTALGFSTLAMLVMIVAGAIQWHGNRDFPTRPGVVNLVGNRTDHGLLQGDVEDVTLRLPITAGPFVATARAVRLNTDRALVCQLLHGGEVHANLMEVHDGEVAMTYAPILRNVEEERGVMDICDAALSARLS